MGQGGALGDAAPYAGKHLDVLNGSTKGADLESRGVANKNIGNIGYGPWAKAHGAMGAAGRDTGRGVAVFSSFEAGAKAAGDLALLEYEGGKKTIDVLIAGQGGWTPGNHGAAAYIASNMGISPFADARLSDPAMLEKFEQGLAIQELGLPGARFAFQHMNRGGEAAGPTDRIGLNLRTASEECVVLAKAAVGALGSVTNWRRGVNAMEGTLKPGAPVPTFLDRQGRTSNRYAGGGTGTRGANLDHAGVFQSYIRYEAGKIIGMKIAEQYRGSGGPHTKACYSGQGWGERPQLSLRQRFRRAPARRR